MAINIGLTRCKDETYLERVVDSVALVDSMNNTISFSVIDFTLLIELVKRKRWLTPISWRDQFYC